MNSNTQESRGTNNNDQQGDDLGYNIAHFEQFIKKELIMAPHHGSSQPIQINYELSPTSIIFINKNSHS